MNSKVFRLAIKLCFHTIMSLEINYLSFPTYPEFLSPNTYISLKSKKIANSQFASVAKTLFRVLFSLLQCCWWDHQVQKTQMAIGSHLSPSWQRLRRKRRSFQWRCWPCPSAQGPTEDQQDSDRILSPAVSRAESWRKFHKLHWIHQFSSDHWS